MELTTAAEPADPKVEADLLQARAAHFMRIGNFDEALVLCEAALLLEPDRVDLYCTAALVLGKLVRMCDQPYTTLTDARRRLADMMRLHRIGQQHYEQAISIDLMAYRTHREALQDFRVCHRHFKSQYPFTAEALEAEFEALTARVLARLQPRDAAEQELLKGGAGLAEIVRHREKAAKEAARRETDAKEQAERDAAKLAKAQAAAAAANRARPGRAGREPITAEFWRERLEQIKSLPDSADLRDRIRELVKRPGGVSIFDKEWAKFLDDVEQLPNEAAKEIAAEARNSIRLQRERNAAAAAERKKDQLGERDAKRAERLAEQERRPKEREGPDPLMVVQPASDGETGPTVRLLPDLAIQKQGPDVPLQNFHNIEPDSVWLACGDGI